MRMKIDINLQQMNNMLMSGPIVVRNSMKCDGESVCIIG